MRRANTAQRQEAPAPTPTATMVDDDAQTQVEADDTSVEDEYEEEDEDEADEDIPGDEEGEDDAAVPELHAEPPTLGLKEISNLGRLTVSSHKLGNGVESLRSDDLGLFWQSDGPQPHRLTIYFVKRVDIREIRFYVNYNEDESYTPTNIVFKSGTSENNLIEFAHLNLESPVGWQQVPLAGAGGGADGNTLVSYVLQMQILENHQNGKDTHLRALKIYAFDPESAQVPSRENNPVDEMVEMMVASPRQPAGVQPAEENVRLSLLAQQLAEANTEPGDGGFE
ncbi:anaphase-promoting complex subunit 10, partial [Emericellopsis cladophorae]